MQFLLVHSMMICSRDLQSQWSKCSNMFQCQALSHPKFYSQIMSNHTENHGPFNFCRIWQILCFSEWDFSSHGLTLGLYCIYLCADPNFQVAPYRAVNIKIPQNPQSFPSSLRGQSRLEAHASTSRQHLKNPSLQSKAKTPSLWTKTAKIQHLIVLKF